jgi:DNA-binding beta-propeller fold protein YncE
MKSPTPVLAMAIVVLLAMDLPAADLRGARLFKSGTIQISADGSRAWCVNPDNDSVSRIDVPTGAVVEFPLPAGTGRQSPRGLSIMDDGS